MELSEQQNKQIATALASEFLAWIAEEKNRQQSPASEICRKEEIAKSK